MLYTTITIKDVDYKLRLNARGSVDLEKKLGTNPLNIFTKMTNGDMPKLSELMIIFHQSLLPYQHEIKLDDVYGMYDDFIEDGKTMIDFIPIIVEIFKVSGFFREEEVEDNPN